MQALRQRLPERVHGLLLPRLQQGGEIGAGLLVEEVVLLQPLDRVPNVTWQSVELRPPFRHEFFHLLHGAGLIGALLLEQNDEWAVQRGRYMSLESLSALSDDPVLRLSAVAA